MAAVTDLPEITHTFAVPLPESVDFEISGDPVNQSLVVTVTDSFDFHALVQQLEAVASRLIAV